LKAFSKKYNKNQKTKNSIHVHQKIIPPEMKLLSFSNKIIITVLNNLRYLSKISGNNYEQLNKFKRSKNYFFNFSIIMFTVIFFGNAIKICDQDL